MGNNGKLLLQHRLTRARLGTTRFGVMVGAGIDIGGFRVEGGR